MYHDQQTVGLAGSSLGSSLGAPRSPYEQAQQAAAKVGRDRGQLEASADSIANAIGELGASIDLLEQTLTPVLQGVMPQPVGHNSAAPAPAIPISPAVSYLQEQRRRIEVLVLRVNDIRSRLDT